MTSAPLSTRIADYAFRFWQRRDMTEWPSVRRVAKALHIQQSAIEDESGVGEFCTQSYNCHPPQPFGEHEVCAMTPAVDVAWQQYYQGYQK